MKTVRAALAGLLSLLSVVSAFAQSAPPNMGFHTVYGRLGKAPGDVGPGQEIPFATLTRQFFSGASFQVSNPGNAALYSQLANPADGYTTVYNGMQISLGTPIPTGEQFGNGGAVGEQQAVVGTAQMDAGDINGGAWGVVGYAKSNSANPSQGAVGVGGYGKCNATNSSCWGANFVVHNQSPYALNGGHSVNWMAAQESDVNIWKGAGGTEPTIGNVFGLYIYGGDDSAANQGSGVAVAGLSQVTGAKFTNGFWAVGGCCVNALLVGPTAKTGNSLASQPITLNAINSSGGTIGYEIFGDANGNLILQSPATGAIDLGDANGNYVVTNGSGSGAKVRFPALATAATAGAIVNDSGGNLSSSTAVPNSYLAPMNANTTKCNATGGSAQPTDCSAATERTNLGVTATGSDATYAYRANNLSDLANAGTARTNLGLTATAIAAAGQLPGTATNDTASAGNVGEYVESVVVTGSAVSLVTATGKNVTSISLTAGDWDVDGIVNFNLAATTSATITQGSLSLVTNTADTTPGRETTMEYNGVVPGGGHISQSIPNYRLSLASTTTVFLVAQSTFTTSTMTAYGIIRARRAR
jgi:hypothetical protein